MDRSKYPNPTQVAMFSILSITPKISIAFGYMYLQRLVDGVQSIDVKDVDSKNKER